jgi:hypothetical protein
MGDAGRYDRLRSAELASGRTTLLDYALSAVAVVTSFASFVVSVLSYRAAGPRVTLTRHSLSIRPYEVYLQVKIINSGMGEVDVDGATCDLLGPTVTVMPHRLKAAASHVIVFRAPPSAALGRSASVTVNVGLGNGRTLTSQVRLSEAEQADLRRVQSDLQTVGDRSIQPTQAWKPPTQEQL